jgi:NADH-quinone oxidoreductase subunit N
MPVTQGIDYAAIAPPLILAAAALCVLMADLFLPARRRGLLGRISLGGVLAALAADAVLATRGGSRGTFCLPAAPRGSPASCSYVVDHFTLLFQIVALAAAVVVLLMAAGEIRATALPAGEFHFLVLCSLAGALTLIASRDLITLAVSLEVVSLPVFALAALRRYDGRSSEAGLKMFLISVISTAVMLFGISLVYGVTGSMQLGRIAAALALDRHGTLAPAAAAGIALVLVGFGFKVSAVPFHFWVPDTYEGAPLPVAAFLAVVSKTAGFAGLILVLVAGFWPFASLWSPLVAVLAAVTMTVGNLVALRQRQAVRLLAWSSVAQAGYMLVPLGALGGILGRTGAGAGGRAAGAAGGGAAGAGVTAAGVTSATITYVAIYAIMNAGAFAVVALVAKYRPRNMLDDYRGLARCNPLSALALAFFLACLAGLPPGLAGLFAKIIVFRAAIDGTAAWLAIVVAVNTVIGLYYYLTWAARLFAPLPAAVAGNGAVASAVPAGTVAAAGALPVPRAVGAAIGVAAAGTVILSLAPELVLHVTPLALSALG